MNESPTVVELESQPDWGRGIVLEDRPDKWVLLFEAGGRRVFSKSLTKGLKPVELDADAALALDAKLRGRRLPATGASRKSKPAKKAAAATYNSFEDQVRWFESSFTGGFEGERFVAEERGLPERKGKNGYNQAAIALAREQLAPERFQGAEVEELFEVTRKLIQFTNIVHPMEGGIAFGTMKPEDRAGFVRALGELLHGEGDYGARFERFIDTLRFTDAEGKTKRVTWPTATLLPAIYHPDAHVCVKPTFFEKQAPIVGLSVDKSQPPSGENYARFLEVARATQKRLHEAGHPPRDLMDVYSFIWRSQSEKPA